MNELLLISGYDSLQEMIWLPFMIVAAASIFVPFVLKSIRQVRGEIKKTIKGEADIDDDDFHELERPSEKPKVNDDFDMPIPEATLKCQYCGGVIKAKDKNCSGCGAPRKL